MSPQPSKETTIVAYPQLSIGSGRTINNHRLIDVYKDRFAITKTWIYNSGSQTPSYYNEGEPLPRNEDVPQAPIPSKPTSPLLSPPAPKATRRQGAYSRRARSLALPSYFAPLPHISFRKPINFFSKPLPPEIRQRIIPELPAKRFESLQQFMLSIPEPELRPLSHEITPYEFKQLYAYLLEMRDLVWVELIVVERSASDFVEDPRLEHQRKQCARAIHQLKLLSVALSHGLDYMFCEATCKSRSFRRKISLKKIASSRFNTYHEGHPVRLIRPYLDDDKLSVYLDVFPGLDKAKA